MTLSKEDIQVLKWEKTKRENDAKYSMMPNGEERERLWNKSWELHKKISAVIYDHTGNYRKDLKHLLTGGSLDIHLLDEIKA
jgi:hypothetical protein